MTRILLFMLLLVPEYLLSQNKSGLFNYDNNNKISYVDTIAFCKDPFALCIKRKLSKIAVEFNAGITQVENKMEDYIIFEDTSMIVANIRLKTEQLMQRSLWNVEASFKKVNSGIVFYLENITLLKNATPVLGIIDGSITIETLDTKRNISQIKKVKAEIVSLMSILNSN